MNQPAGNVATTKVDVSEQNEPLLVNFQYISQTDESWRMIRTDFWKTQPNMEEFFPEIGKENLI